MKIDWWLVLPSLLLFILGLVVLRSVAPQYVIQQLIFFAFSAAVFWLVSSTDFQLPFTLHLPAYFISVVLLLTPYLFGTHTRGAIRWLQFSQFSLQPSEVAKPFFLITFAMLAVSGFRHRILWLTIAFFIPWLIIFFQPDLGTSLVFLVGWLVILVSHLRLRDVIALGFLLITIIPLSYFILQPYQQRRLVSFVNPYSDPLGQGYHVIQSLIAVGSGQVLGRGLGHGTQSQLRFLPEHHTDFIFASLSEELGFVGGLLVLSLFACLLWRIYRISQITSHPAAALFCLSTLALFSFQIFVNIGMNMGLAPVTGITLPWLSYGGSSLLSTGLFLGLVNSISTHHHLPTSLRIR